MKYTFLIKYMPWTLFIQMLQYYYTVDVCSLFFMQFFLIIMQFYKLFYILYTCNFMFLDQTLVCSNLSVKG